MIIFHVFFNVHYYWIQKCLLSTFSLPKSEFWLWYVIFLCEIEVKWIILEIFWWSYRFIVFIYNYSTMSVTTLADQSLYFNYLHLYIWLGFVRRAHAINGPRCPKIVKIALTLCRLAQYILMPGTGQVTARF